MTDQQRVLRNIVKAINTLDEVSHIKSSTNIGKENCYRLNIARNNLINIVFDNGFEIDFITRRLIKSKSKRELV